MNFVEELRWRGMLHDIMPGTEEQLNSNITSGYIGFDPTADSLHVGHLTQIMTLIHFQRAGHKPFALVGGATGMVGDPSGKSAERNLLSENVLNHNVKCIETQLKKFLDFDSDAANHAEMVNNYDWFKNFSFLDFIRDVGKHLTVNYMMAKDSVKKRLEGETGMSFTEFSYQLVQGYDFYYLWKEKNCQVQMGGSDQWGNIVTGTELIRRKGSGSAFAITTQLIKKADGTKFGKTEDGAIWLDEKRTKPFDFYKFWYNTSDEDAKAFIRIFTLLDRKTIEDLESRHINEPHLRLLQNTLAEDITTRVHGQEAYKMITITNKFTYDPNYKWEELLNLTEKQFLDIFIKTNIFLISKRTFSDLSLSEDNILEFLFDLRVFDIEDDSDDKNNVDKGGESKKMFESKNEAKKLILNGGVYINKIKISLENKLSQFKLKDDKYLFVQKGKKNSALIVVGDDISFEMQRIRELLNR